MPTTITPRRCLPSPLTHDPSNDRPTDPTRPPARHLRPSHESLSVRIRRKVKGKGKEGEGEVRIHKKRENTVRLIQEGTARASTHSGSFARQGAMNHCLSGSLLARFTDIIILTAISRPESFLTRKIFRKTRSQID